MATTPSSNSNSQTKNTFGGEAIKAAAKEGLEPNLRRQLRFLGGTEGLELDVIGATAQNLPYRRQGVAFPTDVEQAIELARHADDNSLALGCFLRINAVRPTVMAEKTRGQWLQSERGQSTIDLDIGARRCFYIDVDPIRDGDQDGPTSHAEMELGVNLARKAVALISKTVGKHCCGLMMSGNGGQCWVALDDIPYTPEMDDIIWDVLNGVRAKLHDDRVKFDLGVFNASRLGPIAGTVKRKGEKSDERPWRRSWFVAPSTVQRLDLADLQRLYQELAVAGVVRDRKPVGQIDPNSHWGEMGAVPIAAVMERLGLDATNPRCPACGAGGNHKTDVAVLVDRNCLKCLHATCGAKAWGGIGLVAKVALGLDELAGNRDAQRQVEEWFAREFGIVKPVIPDEIFDDVVAVTAAEEAQPDWTKILERKDRGRGYKGTIGNVRKWLMHKPGWGVRLAWDDFAMRVVWRAVPSEAWIQEFPKSRSIRANDPWDDSATRNLTCCLNNLPMEPGREAVTGAVMTVAERQTVHPVREYLDSVPWDGVPRLDSWLHRYLGAEDSVYTKRAGRRWMIQAVRRIYEPGALGKYVLVLEGPQNIGKSAALRILASQPWFLESKLDINSKEAAMLMQGNWIVELAEGEILTRSSVEALKQFIGNVVDEIVPKYSNMKQERPRQAVFAMTINPSGEGTYLLDQTGNVRFMPVPVSKVDFDALRSDRDQLWAEAVAAYRANESPEAESEEEIKLFAEEADNRVHVDPWQATVEAALRGVTVTAVHTILKDVLMVDSKQQERRDAGRLSHFLHRLGFQRSARKEQWGGARCYVFRRSVEAAGTVPELRIVELDYDAVGPL